ncbi:MAG TPA: hypothetical protein VNL77_13480 [Roseiflexaceae bacterium]|nr:hypothetical protein [Roseiflexaceae bacterium]
METLLLVGVAALFALAMMGGGQQPMPKVPQVIYVVAEAPKGEGGKGGGCLLLLAIGAIALLALNLPA